MALHDKGILLNTLHWPDEIRSSAELSIPESDSEVQKRELDMAVMLVENLSAKFDPQRHVDEYREALLKVVEAKLEDRPLERPAAPEPASVTDLMAALKASVEAAQAGRRGEESGSTKARTAKAAKSTRSEPARRRKAS